MIEGASLIDDMPYAARFNHCYGVTVSTFSGQPELSQCLVVSVYLPAAATMTKAKESAT